MTITPSWDDDDEEIGVVAAVTTEHQWIEEENYVVGMHVYC
jgi:hypothetical protein